GDIWEYQDKLNNVAQAGIFDFEASRTVVADRIAAWGLNDESVLKKFVRS
ncbi:MAG: acyl-ACP desaturase, partial [Mycolicibacterium aromaticivorans]|nr:acyl-ACP desaturase [Mycolicibacterium aromaticivorans]